ncbi:hypothetical protein DPMN_113473 [Dreissena polymorpha]|uniref:Uncharacterized protein n=1 Tax=Dreissena polymorpha TaxID=45954 RepID=A0A9D4QQQ1_DREPO|nr:hypothetical protein DPMN_113473 [Dreissena polymorpha]
MSCSKRSKLEVCYRGMFVRRGYLFRHLIMCHNFAKQAAYDKAVSASRDTNATPAAYDEEVSSDDSTFNLLQEIEDFSSLQPVFTTKELNFEIDYYLDEVLLDFGGEVDIDMDRPSVEISGEDNVIGDSDLST